MNIVAEYGTLIFSALSVLAWIVTQFNTIKILQDKVDKHERSVEELQKDFELEILRLREEFNNDIKTLEIKMTSLSEKGNRDVLEFTQILGKINVTLAKFETTMTNINENLNMLRQTMITHDNEIRQLAKK